MGKPIRISHLLGLFITLALFSCKDDNASVHDSSELSEKSEEILASNFQEHTATDSIFSFQLKEADKDLLVEELSKDTTGGSMTYLYLVNYYDSIASKDSLQYDEWDKRYLCGFAQNFSETIHYSSYSCGEGGESETVIFPRIKDELMHQFIESTFYNEENTWYEKRSYGPDGAGCYYHFKHSDSTTILNIYCGC